MRRYPVFASVFGAAALWLSAGAAAQDRPAFNEYVIKSVEKIYRERAGGGYNINKAFTRDLTYGGETIKATGPTDTMCVAGVAEVIIEAINLYAAETHDQAVYAKLPASHWKRSSLTSLRGNIFMVQGAGSRGTANALQRFGLGKELRFPELKRGDFVNLNRPDIPTMPGNQASGHAVVFWDFIHANGDTDGTYRPDVIGFKYFSAQGKGKPDAGFAFRWAYFGPNCPAATPGKPRDCRVIKSTNPILLNVGRMYAPSEWHVREAVARLTASTRSIFYADAVTRGMSGTLAAAEAQRQLGLERPIDKPELLTGETTD
jgi:hypothetical protein